jgi:ABC-2 type transport system permease protein
MKKFWYVALNEYKRHVFRKGFIFAILSVPLLISFSVGVGYLAANMENNSDPVGYVDLSGMLENARQVPEGAGSKNPVEIIAYPNEKAASDSLEKGDIQAYYVIAEDYQDSQAASLFYIDEPGENAESHFRAFIRTNLVTDQPPDIAYRALDGLDVVVRTPDGTREFSGRNALNLVLPAVTGFIFMFLLMTSSGYLAGAVAEEKENQTMEILATSMSTNQFITGKVLGIICVSLTQLVTWVLFAAIAIQVGGNVLEVPWLQNIEIQWGPILTLLAILVPSYVMYVALILTISGTVTQASEGQQLAGIFALPLGFSYWFAVIILRSPNSLLAVALSIFPFTAPTLMPLRTVFMVVPLEQILVSAVIQVVFAIFSIWLAARAFELGMLRYGQRLSFRELFQKAQ